MTREIIPSQTIPTDAGRVEVEVGEARSVVSIDPADPEGWPYCERCRKPVDSWAIKTPHRVVDRGGPFPVAELTGERFGEITCHGETIVISLQPFAPKAKELPSP